jgi:hypothetical protein
MLDFVLSAVPGSETPVTVERVTTAYVQGRPQNTFAAPVSYTVREIADGPDSESLHEDSGSQKLINRHFYFHGQPPIFVYDRITCRGVRYESHGVEHRREGNFTYVYGKAIERLLDVGTGSD